MAKNNHGGATMTRASYSYDQTIAYGSKGIPRTNWLTPKVRSPLCCAYSTNRNATIKNRMAYHDIAGDIVLRIDSGFSLSINPR
jgi:hypothetical protein